MLACHCMYRDDVVSSSVKGKMSVRILFCIDKNYRRVNWFSYLAASVFPVVRDQFLMLTVRHLFLLVGIENVMFVV